jgi:hypothetical protein
MAKHRIQNYVFLPGVGSDSNAVPNAYTLIKNNRTFIQKEAIGFIAATIISDNAINLNPFAVTLLTNNKTFLQDEITAWIAAQVAGNISPFVGYTYDAAKCKRDVGYVIDAYINDIRYGGNENIIQVASQYWLGGVAQVDGDRQPEIVAHTKLRDIINTNILPRLLYSSQQSPVLSSQNTSGTSAESGVTTTITALSGILINVIANGLSVLPNVTYSVRNFPNYIYDSEKCERDIGYVIDAYLNDIRYGGNVKTRFVASRYWVKDVPQIDGDRKPEIVTHQFIRDLIVNTILPQEPYGLPYQSQVPIYTNGDPSLAGESLAIARITDLSAIIVDVITNGLSSLPAVINGVSSIKIQGRYRLDELLLITNATNNQIIYNFSDSTLGAVAVVDTASNTNGILSDDDFPTFLQTADYVTTLTLKANTSTSLKTDDIQIFVESNEVRTRPYDFGTDAIERMRVAQPQSMLDADFEYGLQPTKWQAIAVSRGYPSVYEVPGTDTGVLTVTTDASAGTAGVGQSLITVTTVGPHGFVIGDPITIKALSNSISGFSRAEGTFIITDVPTTTSFRYYSVARVGTINGQLLSSTYTQLRKGAFYTGSTIGTPQFSVFSNGASGTFLTALSTNGSSDQLTFASGGTVPVIGAPITGTGIGLGTQVTGVIGTGGIVTSKSFATTVLAGATQFDLTDTTGVLEGMAVDNGSGTSVFVASVSNPTVLLTGPLTVNKEGNTQTYTNVSGANLTGIGTGVQFTVSRTNGVYANLIITAQGADYETGNKVRILGTALGGATPANDLIIICTLGFAGTGAFIQGEIFSGVSVSGNRTFQNVTGTSSATGSLAAFNVTTTAGSYSASIYSSTPDPDTGTYEQFVGLGYAIGETITIAGTDLGGASPANDLVITVTSILTGDDNSQPPISRIDAVDAFTVAGTAVYNATFTGLTSTHESPAGDGATFNVVRNNGTYSVTLNQPGTGYLTGDRISIAGTALGGTTPTNDAVVRIIDANPQINSVNISGSGAAAATIDFYSSISLSDLTTATIPASTSLSVSAIASIQVTFSTPHGLMPGSNILTSISSTGSNHSLAAGPFYVESTPTANSIRYTARAAGVVDAGTLMAGLVYSRPDSFFVHRPYDGGVQLGTGGPQHGAQAIRQSKKYIRYQSGKGIMYTTGALFAPSYNLQNLTATGTAVGSFITVTTDDVDHGCQVGGVIKIIGVSTPGYNGVYTVTDVITERQFRIQAQTVLGNIYATLSTTAQMSVDGWHGATVRAGTFDDQNGMFWQYNGKDLSVGRRSSTFQLAGFANVARDSNIVTGTNTRFRDQLNAGDRIVIKGMTHVVSAVTSDTRISITPDFRGTVDVTQVKLCLVQDFIIPQSEFNMDRVDGTGPSGYNVDITKMQMIGIQWSWYGAGFIDYMLRGSDGNFIFVHRIRNSNVNTEAYMRTGNMPVRYEVLNEGPPGKLAKSITASQTTIQLVDASKFPDDAGTIQIDNELISFTGKSGNTLVGCTRAAPLINFVGGAQRTFRGGVAATHEYNTGVVLVSNTISPIISHWGSAIITDGRFDEDRGYIFNYAATNISVSTTRQTAFLIRLAPSVSNAIVGDLGERELLNRAQLLLKGIEITSDTGTGGIVVEGVLNPQNYPTNVAAIAWSGLQGAAQGGQPSFAQIAPGGSVQWSSGATQTTAAATTSAFITGNITATTGYWGGGRSIENNQNFFVITRTDYDVYLAGGLQVGDAISGTGIQANTTITQLFIWFGNFVYVGLSRNTNANVVGPGTLTVSKNYQLTNTSTIFFQRASWESTGATQGSEVADTLFSANTRVTTVTLLSYFSTQYYRVTFTQTSSSTPINAGTTTITFRFGQPPFALPGETIFSFISAPGTSNSLDLSELKELTSSTLGGRGTYPNGPDVLAINVYKASGAAIPSNIILRWGEAQA